ncbi:N-acetyltransferase [Brevibacillus fluminis]|uniref:N-acetyltransferase n=1 Tax=Brevibacillus fluminis TaxID=511487 RepID=A0A3M8DR64_9BACL|nr:GNAT family N-acetyltransferase [Brevibacillus fluminis]RNB89487.1 N-acetyltransferase [Brevibacillus fluminis]
MIPVLETERLRLRPLEPSDADVVQTLAGSKEVASTTLSIPHPYPDGAAEAWIGSTHQSAAIGEHYAFAIMRKDDGALLGCIGLGVTKPHNRAELGYWLGVQYWGQGYVTEAARRILTFGFTELSLNKIVAIAMTKNPASASVMRKIGMKHEGTFHQHIMKWGVYEDVVYYGMVKADIVETT